MHTDGKNIHSVWAGPNMKAGHQNQRGPPKEAKNKIALDPRRNTRQNNCIAGHTIQKPPNHNGKTRALPGETGKGERKNIEKQ